MNRHLTNNPRPGADRRGWRLLLLLLAAWSLSASASLAPPVVNHRIDVTLEPDLGWLSARDRMTLATPVTRLEFMLHDGLMPRLTAPEGRIQPLEAVSAPVPARRYRVELLRPGRTLTLEWVGRIRHPVSTRGDRPDTPGTLAPEGVFLAGSSLWFPWIESRRLTFDLQVHLPRGWRALSQGRALAPDHWRETHPQDDLYLVAAPFVIQRRPSPPAAEVWLRQPDPELARRDLDAIQHYLRFYSRLLGDYPYAKFALVENFWESGYGMPSFTLLGPKVIRLPFILHTALPHEILHDWWGNSVYVDPASGNWAEGLTTYLSDHLWREARGSGAAYRRDQLASFAAWVKQGRDRPLTAFHARHGEASQAAGYGRMMMLVHMLRLELGDDLFIEGLRRFYHEHRFRLAGFDDLRRSLEMVSGLDLKARFDQWTRRTGAPRLALGRVRSEATPDGHRLEVELRQLQPEPPFRLQVPLYVQLQGSPEGHLYRVEMSQRRQTFVLNLPARPVRLRVDPLYDLFRRLTPDERPPSVAGLLGAERLWLVLPAQAPAARLAAWRALARAWQQRYPGIRVILDQALTELPSGDRLWVLGRENRWLPQARKALAGLPVRFLTEDELILPATARQAEPEKTDRYSSRRGAIVLAGRHWGVLQAPGTRTIEALARKLPHYGRYGYLVFDTEGHNRLKGQWPTHARSLEAVLDPRAPAMVVPDHPPLARLVDSSLTPP